MPIPFITTDEGVDAREQVREGGDAGAQDEERREAAQRQAAEAEQEDGIVDGPHRLGEVKLPKKPRAYSTIIASALSCLSSLLRLRLRTKIPERFSRV